MPSGGHLGHKAGEHLDASLQAAGLVQLRFFSGLTVDEAATMLGLSPRTARRLWVFARAWLRRDMERAANATS